MRVKNDIKAYMCCNAELAAAILLHLVNQKLIVKHSETVRRGRNTCDAFHLPGALIQTELDIAGQDGQNEVVPLVRLECSDGAKSEGLEGQGQAPIGGCPSVPLSVAKIPVPKKHKKQTARTKQPSELKT